MLMLLHARSHSSKHQQHGLRDDDLTQPGLPAFLLQGRVIATRSIGSSTLLLDELGNLYLCTRGREARVLSPDETFDLLDFLYAHRNTLAARSLEHALQKDEKKSE